MLHDEVAEVVGPVGAEAEALEALAVLVDEPVLLEEGTELEEDVWECRRRIDLLLRACRCGGRGKEGRVKGGHASGELLSCAGSRARGAEGGEGRDKGRGV